MEKGRFLSQSDNDQYENYAVLASETAARLFPYEDPLDKSVKLGTDYYKVIGVTRERASSAGTGGSLAAQDFNKDVYIPLNTCKLRFGERIMNSRAGSMEAEETQLSQITLQVGSIEQVRPTAPIIERRGHALPSQEGRRHDRPLRTAAGGPGARPGSSASSWARSPRSRCWSAASAS